MIDYPTWRTLHEDARSGLADIFDRLIHNRPPIAEVGPYADFLEEQGLTDVSNFVVNAVTNPHGPQLGAARVKKVNFGPWQIANVTIKKRVVTAYAGKYAAARPPEHYVFYPDGFERSRGFYDRPLVLQPGSWQHHPGQVAIRTDNYQTINLSYVPDNVMSVMLLKILLDKPQDFFTLPPTPPPHSSD